MLQVVGNIAKKVGDQATQGVEAIVKQLDGAMKKAGGASAKVEKAGKKVAGFLGL